MGNKVNGFVSACGDAGKLSGGGLFAIVPVVVWHNHEGAAGVLLEQLNRRIAKLECACVGGQQVGRGRMAVDMELGGLVVEPTCFSVG